MVVQYESRFVNQEVVYAALVEKGRSAFLKWLDGLDDLASLAVQSYIDYEYQVAQEEVTTS